MKKILFTDLDGTLLKNDKTISKKNREAIKKMLQMGHYVVVTTGRPVESGFRVVKDLGLTEPGCYMLAFNGAVVYDCSADRILTERTINIEYVEYLFEEAEKYGLHIQTYNRTHLLTSSYNREVEHYVHASSMPYKIIKNVFSVLDFEPNKVLLINLDDKERLLKFQQDHREWEKGKCNSFFSCEEYLEYCPANTDKGRGIRFLSEHLNIDMKNTYSIGDERNDVSMLLAAGTSFAVKNAVQEAKEAATILLDKDNEEDAVAEVIEKYIL